MSTPAGTDSVREKILTDYRKKLLEHKELEARLKESKYLTLIQKTVQCLVVHLSVLTDSYTWRRLSGPISHCHNNLDQDITWIGCHWDATLQLRTRMLC